MKPQTHEFTYPESELIYEELPKAEVDVFLPEYVTKVIREHAEMLDAEVWVKVWWPYLYVFIERDVAKDVESCYDDAWRDAEKEAEAECRERCGDDKNCHEECVDELRYDIYQGCREGTTDELRPKIARAVHDLERVFKLYGIEAEVGERWYGDRLVIESKLTGYRMPVLMDAGIMILIKIISNSMSKSYKNREKLAYKLTSALYRYLSESQIFELATSLDNSNIRITRVLDSYNDVRRYEMLIEWKDIKIVLYTTEEKKDDYWAVTNIDVGYVEQAVADLTSV